MLVQDHSTPIDPSPTLLLSHLPSEELQALTQRVANSPTRGLGLTERATMQIEIDPEPLSRVAIDVDPVVRAARYLRGQVRRYGRHYFGGHTLARQLEGVYSPWGVRPTFDADRGPYPRFLDTGWDYAAVGSVAAVPVS